MPLQSFMNQGSSKRDHYHQTQLMTLNKVPGLFNSQVQTSFASEFCIELPQAGISNPVNYKLVFVVYMPQYCIKNNKVEKSKITEKMVMDQPSEYNLKPTLFAIQSVFSSFATINLEEVRVLTLFAFNKSEQSFEQQILNWATIKPADVGKLSIRIDVVSNQYSQSRLTESQKFIVSDNELVTRFNRIVFNLLHNYGEGIGSKKTLKQLISILDKLSQMAPFKSLLKDALKNFEPESESVLYCLQNQLKELDETISKISNIFFTSSSSFDQVDYEKLLKKIQYLPLLLDCRCKSFSFYFELNYKQLAHQIQDFMVKIGINRQIVLVIKQESQKALIKNPEFNLQRLIRNLRNCLKILNDYFLENGDTIIFQELKQNQIMGNVGRNTVLFSSHFENDFVYERRQSKQDSITERISYEQSKQLTNQIEKVNLLDLKYQEFSADAMKTILNITENLHQQLNLQDHSLCKQIFEIKDQKRIKNLSDQNQVDQFESLLEKFKHDLKKYLLSGQHFSLQNQVASFESARTSSQITAMFNNYNQYRKKLRLLFYKKINKTLQAVRYFIDCDFLKKIFDTLLRPIENNLDQIIKNCLPLYKLDKENLPEEINKTIQEEFGTIQISDFKLLFDQSLKDLKVKQQTDIDIQAIAKIKMICKILTLDVIFTVPAQYNEANSITSEYIAQKCSQSVYLLMKQYKSSVSLVNLNIKDKTTSEWFYLFLYQMSEFDKKIANNVVCIAPTQSEVYPAPDKFSQSNLKSTDQQMINIIDDNPQIIEERKSADDQGSSSQYNLSGYGLEETRESGSIIIKESDASYIELARLKSSKQILLCKADSTAIERRFCWFFNDLEDAFLKHQILKDPHQKLANKQLVDLKLKYNSLLSVIAVHHLSKMTSQSLRVLYVDRPGSLDRLIKQVASMVTNYQFHQYELYFNIKKLHVADAFSKELINMLCDIKNQIAGQLVKNTFKSILSQVWLLQYKLFALYSTAYYEFKYTGQYAPNEQYAFDLQQFEKKLKSHAQTQLFLYDSFKDMGDIILPNESEPQREIQNLLFSIVKKDLENMKSTKIDKKMLETLMRQLAQMYVQIDFLTFKSKSILSQQAFEQIEFLFITVFEQDLNSNQKNSQNHKTLIKKKEQIYNAFCDQYFEIVKQQIGNGQDTVFGQQLNKRAYEVNLIKDLYMQVIQYERLVNNQQEIYQKGHIISQLIAFSTLMIKLQDNNLTFSFKNMMNGKYKTMIDNIDSILNEHFYKQKKDAEDKKDIFMKHESQFLNQMREVKAFMQYEDFKTFMTAIDLGYLNSQSKAIKKMYEEIYNVVNALLPKSEECQDWVNENQFFDKALQLLNEDVKKSYRKEAVRQTLAKQIECLQLYKSFQRRNLYCKYWRVDIEKYLPESARVENRILIYRSSPNHDPSFITSDLQVLLGLEKSDQLDIKILQILTNKEREIFQILQNTKGLSNTCDENFKNCPENFKTFYQCNYKSQFFTIEQINTDSKNFDEQYQITIYEVMKSFPTFTPFQKVETKFIKRIPVVQYTLKKELEEYITEIQDLIEKSNQDQYSDEQNQNKNTEQFIGQAINKYLINDGVAGGLGVQIQKYFNKGLAKGFVDLDSNLKHAYLELYKGFESVFVELDKLLDVYKKMALGEAQIYKKGKDGLSERREILKKAYKDSELKEYEDGKL